MTPSLSETVTARPAEARKVNVKDTPNYSAPVDPCAETVQFTVIDHVLFRIRELGRSAPDLAGEADAFHDLIARKSELTINTTDMTVDEVKRAKEMHQAVVVAAAEEVLGSVEELMKSRPFKAKDALRKAPDKFDHYVGRHMPKGKDSQRNEIARQQKANDRKGV